MSAKAPSVEIPDSRVAVEMLKSKLVNESQLKAAIDYQESLGGGLLDIVVKLGLVRKESIDRCVRRLLGEDDPEESRESEADLHVDADDLRAHRKRLEDVLGAKAGIPSAGEPPAEDDSRAASGRAVVNDTVGVEDPSVLVALVGLLERKGIVSKDELRVELELLRRRGEP